MELGSRPQPERGALGILGKLEMLGECGMFVALVAEILDQAVMQRHQEIVRARSAVVLLGIQPARRDVGVPGKDYFAGRHGGFRPRRTLGRRDRRQRRGAARQDAAPAQRDTLRRRRKRITARDASQFVHERTLPARPS
jgi:hypothetical protein